MKPRAQGFGAAIVFALVVGLLVVVVSSDGGGLVDEIDPGIPPAEFLYIDNDRVAAYLAQLQGGRATGERLSRTLTREVSGTASAGGSFEVGASAQEQRFVEREVTPTAASNYFRLFDALVETEDERIQLRGVDDPRDYDQLARLHEGDFVHLSTRDLLDQGYIKPYLVVRQSGTLAALFPLAEGRVAREQRQAARGFARQVGPNPRFTFVLDASVVPRPEDTEKRSVRYLFPVQYEQLSDERSLLEGGGGRFTVVGKVIRVFRQPDLGVPEYVDTATRETWREPLKHVPAALLDRASFDCEAQSIRATRECLQDKMRNQTLVPDRGAVILPIAIHK